jgi:predicted Zn-dependent protease
MEIGRGVEEEMGVSLSARTDEEPKLQKYVQEVGSVVAANVARKGIAYHFHVLDTLAVNAFALPGGTIYVTTGMINFLGSEAELAAILGHEVSHVDLKHPIGRLQYELIARKVVGRDLATIARVGYTLVALGFSEQEELEADATGVILAAKAGYDPRAAESTFARLMQREPRERPRAKAPTTILSELAGSVIDVLEQYFATHPPTKQRIEEIDKVLARNGAVWRGTRFYEGVQNYDDRVPRATQDRTDEWKLYAGENVQ